MPTPIDQLVVVLGLESVGFVSATRKVSDEYKKFKDKLDQHNKEVQESGEKAAFGIDKLRLGVAGLAGIMAGVSAYEIDKWIMNMTHAGTATYNLGVRTQTSAGQITALRGAMLGVGGSAEDADAALNSMVNTITRLQLYGDTGKLAQLAWLGVNLADFGDLNKKGNAERMMLALSAGAARQPAAKAATILSDIGLSTGAIDLILRGPAKMKELIDYAKQFSGAADGAAKAAAGVTEELGKTSVVMNELNNQAYKFFGPGIGDAIKTFRERFLEPLARGDTWEASKAAGAFGWEAAKKGVWWASGGPAISSLFKAGATAFPATANTQELLSQIISEFPEIRQITGVNDKFHQGRLSPHNQGRAFDFTLQDPAQAEAVAARIRALHPNTTVLNEYAHRSAGSTGPHIHVQVNVNVPPGSDGKRIGAEVAEQAKRGVMAAQSGSGSQ